LEEGRVCPGVAARTEGVLKAIMLTKLKSALAVVLTVTAVGVGAGALAHAVQAADGEARERAIAEIVKAKGWVGVDEKRPGKPVTRVELSGTPGRANRLAALVKAFPQLREFSAC
jgi:hypothetical protein